MAKLIARKAFRGQEGPVRVGQVLDTADHPSLTKERVAALTRNGLLEGYSDKMAAAPRNQAFRAAREPAGVVSPNAGGLVELGWDPAKAQADRVRAIGEDGDDENPSPGGQDGSSTSAQTIDSSALSRAARPQGAPATSSGERPRRGRRPAS